MGSAFNQAWTVLKMGPMPPDFDDEYSHKDLDAEALIDFLIENLGMEYSEAKTLVTHHKTKEMASASRRKAMKNGPKENGNGGPPMPPMNGGMPGMGM
mgnify:CR=1 FL=1|tara:strand:- start:4765 stop:5058 length:294 start_codon:yes stop_codon:yes gene_type:complete